MSVSLYISGSRIQVVEGSRGGGRGTEAVSVDQVWTLTLPPEVLENGNIIDEKAFVTTMRDFWKENELPGKDVTLLLYNRLATLGTVEAPPANEKRTLEFIKRELTVYEEDVEAVYAYDMVKKADRDAVKESKKEERRKAAASRKNKNRNKKQEALLEEFPELAEEKQGEETELVFDNKNIYLAGRIGARELKRNLDLLAFAGIRINSIQSGTMNLVRVFSGLPELKGETCIVQIYDDQYHINLLYLNGVYHYSSATRIFEEEGTIGFAIEVARSISGILQFMKANNLEYDTMKVFLVGLDTEDMLNCTDSILQMNSSLIVEEIDVERLVDNGAGESIDKYLVVCSGFVPGKKTADFYTDYQKYGKKKTGSGDIRKAILPIGIPAVILLTVTIVLGIMNLLTGMKLQKAQEYNNSVLQAVMEYDSMLQDAEHSEKQFTLVDDLKEDIASYPLAGSAVEAIVQRTAAGYVDVIVQSYDAVSGLYNLSTSAENVELINRYIAALRKLDVFVSVDYSGYVHDDTTGKWQVKVNCYLSEKAGKGNKEK